jgi:hypothetical protein
MVEGEVAVHLGGLFERLGHGRRRRRSVDVQGQCAVVGMPGVRGWIPRSGTRLRDLLQVWSIRCTSPEWIFET